MKTLLFIGALFGTFPLHAEPSKVTIHLLDHTDKQKTQTRFWIDWSKTWRGIISSKEVAGEDAEKVIKQLRSSLKNTEALHFCGHDPIYGIEATGSDGKVLKTSLCFTCLTWVKPGSRLEISGEKGPDNKLCKLLREFIELPKELLTKEDPKAIPADG